VACFSLSAIVPARKVLYRAFFFFRRRPPSSCNLRNEGILSTANPVNGDHFFLRTSQGQKQEKWLPSQTQVFGVTFDFCLSTHFREKKIFSIL
jgi:hypothetical protein